MAPGSWRAGSPRSFGGTFGAGAEESTLTPLDRRSERPFSRRPPLRQAPTDTRQVRGPFFRRQAHRRPSTADGRLFTGQERDFDTGQDYFGARQLRTDLGRFLAPDPITLVPRVVGAQDINSYAYVRNNPLGLIDPNGLDPTDLRPEEGDCSWTSWAFREDRGATYDPLGIPPSLAAERGQPVRLIRVGTTTYSQPTKVNGRLFVGTVYEYEVVDEDGGAVTGLIEVEEVHRKTANTRQLPIESIWTTSTGRFKDGVGYYPDAGPAPRSYYNEARQKFIVTQDHVHTTLSTVVLQRWWSDESGHFFGQADIIVR